MDDKKICAKLSQDKSGQLRWQKLMAWLKCTDRLSNKEKNTMVGWSSSNKLWRTLFKIPDINKTCIYLRSESNKQANEGLAYFTKSCGWSLERLD